MTKKALDEKYSYQIDEHNVVHLFRGEDDCQQYLTNPLLSAIFKIEELEKENAELKESGSVICDRLSERIDETVELKNENIGLKNQLTKAKVALRNVIDYLGQFCSDYPDCVIEAEQFLKDKTETESEEPYYVIMNMNCDYEICRRCPKSGLFKGTYEECENWIKEKLSEVEK